MLYDVGMIHENNLLPALLDLLSATRENIIISRDGSPVATLVPYQSPEKPRIGAAEGRMECPADIDFCNDEVARLFYGEAE